MRIPILSKGLIIRSIQRTVFKLVLSLCISVSIATAGSGVRGIVTNSYGFPLSGVLVSALEAEKGEYCWTRYLQSRRMVVADSDGSYCIDLPAGFYSVYITLDSIVCGPGSIIVVDDGYLDVNFREEIVLSEPGSLSGLVTDQSGTPLAGAFVLVQTTGVRVRTDSSGRYIIEDLPPGFHTIETSFTGMRNVTSDSLWILPGLESQCNFDRSSGRSLQETTGRIVGIVKDISGDSIEYLSYTTVIAVDTSYSAMTDFTRSYAVRPDTSGAYCFRSLEPGEYTLTARCMGYLPAHSPIIQVIAGKVFEYNFDPSSYLESDSTGGGLRPQPVCDAGWRMRGRRK